jgi:hypothetical protein
MEFEWCISPPTQIEKKTMISINFYIKGYERCLTSDSRFMVFKKRSHLLRLFGGGGYYALDGPPTLRGERRVRLVSMELDGWGHRNSVLLPYISYLLMTEIGTMGVYIDREYEKVLDYISTMEGG